MRIFSIFSVMNNFHKKNVKLPGFSCHLFVYINWSGFVDAMSQKGAGVDKRKRRIEEEKRQEDRGMFYNNTSNL